MHEFSIPGTQVRRPAYPTRSRTPVHGGRDAASWSTAPDENCRLVGVPRRGDAEETLAKVATKTPLKSSGTPDADSGIAVEHQDARALIASATSCLTRSKVSGILAPTGCLVGCPVIG